MAAKKASASSVSRKDPKLQVTKSQPGSKRVTLLYVIMMALALAGLADALYLTLEHYSGNTVLCVVTTGCSEVLGSPYATVGKVPVALIGAIAYFSVFSLATLGAFDYPRIPLLLKLTVGSMLVVTIGLFLTQALILHAYCAYCLLSALITLSLGVVTFIILTPAEKKRSG